MLEVRAKASLLGSLAKKHLRHRNLIYGFKEVCRAAEMQSHISQVGYCYVFYYTYSNALHALPIKSVSALVLSVVPVVPLICKAYCLQLLIMEQLRAADFKVVCFLR